MAVSTKHPDLTDDILHEWRLMRDSYVGESAVKRRTEAYLPLPGGYRALPDKGEGLYRAYITRARYPEIVSNAIRGMIGVIHGQEWNIELPDALMPLWENCTPDGLTLEAFSRRITKELLITGRYAVLADAPEAGGIPYLEGYGAEQLINWDDDSQSFYVLEEFDLIRNGFTWAEVTRNRVLELVDGFYQQTVYIDGAAIADAQVEARGARRLDYIPLAVGGAMDVELKPDTPPLIGVARAAIAHYQLNADYRLQLFSSGQETLFIYNTNTTVDVVGAGVVVALDNTEGATLQAKAEYVGPRGVGIEAHERAMDREMSIAARSGAALFDNAPRAQESGEARRLRFSAETATLSSIALSSAAIVEKALRCAADLAGANPDDVIVHPPTNLLEGKLDGQTLTSLVQAWEKGAFSYATLYENLQAGRIASTERDADQEQALGAGQFLPLGDNLA